MTHFGFNPGSQLLQDYKAANGSKEGEEEAAVTDSPPLLVSPGLCVRYAPGFQELCNVQRGEQHASLVCGMASVCVCERACRQG